MNFKSILLTISIVFLSPTLVWAQLSSPVTHQLRFLLFNCDPSQLSITQSDVPSGSDQSPDPTFAENRIEAAPGQRSGYYTYDPSKPVKVIRHSGSHIEIVASLDLSKEFLPLLLLTPGKIKDSVVVTTLQDDKANFPGGSFQVFNFSSQLVCMTIGATSRLFQLNQSGLIQPPLSSTAVPLIVSLPKTKQATYASNWLLRNKIRYIFFIVDDPSKPGSVIFLRTQDSVEYLPFSTVAFQG